MKTTTKIILGIVTTSAVGVGAYIYIKKQEIEKVLDNLQIRFITANNFKANFSNLKVDVYLQVINPTDTNLDLDTKFINVEQLRVFDKSTDRALAVSDLKTSRVEILAGGSFDLPKITISIPTLTGADIILSQLQDNKTDFMKRLRFELDLKAFNKLETFNF